MIKFNKISKKIVVLSMIVFTLSTNNNVYALNQSSNWVEATGKWYIKNPDGSFLKNTWFQDLDGSWYLLGEDGAMYSGIVLDKATNKNYLLNTNHDGYFGKMIHTNGNVKIGNKNVYMEFNQAHDGTFGAIVNGLGTAQSVGKSIGMSSITLNNIPTASAQANKNSNTSANNAGGQNQGTGKTTANKGTTAKGTRLPDGYILKEMYKIVDRDGFFGSDDLSKKWLELAPLGWGRVTGTRTTGDYTFDTLEPLAINSSDFVNKYMTEEDMRALAVERGYEYVGKLIGYKGRAFKKDYALSEYADGTDRIAGNSFITTKIYNDGKIPKTNIRKVKISDTMFCARDDGGVKGLSFDTIRKFNPSYRIDDIIADIVLSTEMFGKTADLISYDQNGLLRGTDGSQLQEWWWIPHTIETPNYVDENGIVHINDPSDDRVTLGTGYVLNEDEDGDGYRYSDLNHHTALSIAQSSFYLHR